MPFKAFVSSTFEDLKHHRARVIDDLRKVGVFVDPMEDWAATASEPKTFSRERLEGCDFCVLLVGLRRGYVPDGESRSITQMEYDEAVSRGLDVLVYLVPEDVEWRRSFDELDSDAALRPWREHLMKSHGVEFFDNDPASLDVKAAVARWITDRSAPAQGTNQGAEQGKEKGSAQDTGQGAEQGSTQGTGQGAEQGSNQRTSRAASGGGPEPSAPTTSESTTSGTHTPGDGPEGVVSEGAGFLARLTLERVSGLIIGVLIGAVVLMVVADVIYGNFTEDRHLKSPQQMTLTEYLEDPDHPRSAPLFFLSATPSAEVILTDLKIAHVDEDSVLLEYPSSGDDILVPGEEMHTLGLSTGETVSLQIGRLHQTSLGWVPTIPDLGDLTWERFDRDEVDALRQWKIVAGETSTAAHYIEPEELSFSTVVPEADDTLSLSDAAARLDLQEQLGEWSANRDTLAIRGVQLVGQGWLGREKPHFIVQTAGGDWVAVVYDPQTFSEWHWARDRLQGEEVVVRGVPRASDDADFAAIDASRPERLVMILDGYAISSPDGETVIHLATR